MAKKSTVQRGYGAKHKALRKATARTVEAGLAVCARCGGWIPPGTAWDLDHAPGKDGYLGPSHRACNRRHGARMATALKDAKRPQAPPPAGTQPRIRWTRVWFEPVPDYVELMPGARDCHGNRAER
jgi:hypothetical protein